MSPSRRGALALTPLLVFLLVYLVTSLAVGDFYKVPVSAAFLIASIYAICITSNAAGAAASKPQEQLRATPQEQLRAKPREQRRAHGAGNCRCGSASPFFRKGRAIRTSC